MEKSIFVGTGQFLESQQAWIRYPSMQNGFICGLCHENPTEAPYI